MILADSSFYIAFADSKDKWHAAARKLRARVEREREVVISDLAVAEAVTIIGARKGGKEASLLGEYLTDNCRLEFLDAFSLPEVMREHLRFDGTMSVADAHSVWLMDTLGIHEIVSFDSDFDKVKRIVRVH